MDLFTPDENIGHSYSQRGSRDDFNDDEDNDHESEKDEFPGEITHEGKKVQVMRDEWRERELRFRTGVRVMLMVLVWGMI